MIKNDVRVLSVIDLPGEEKNDEKKREWRATTTQAKKKETSAASTIAEHPSIKNDLQYIPLHF